MLSNIITSQYDESILTRDGFCVLDTFVGIYSKENKSVNEEMEEILR